MQIILEHIDGVVRPALRKYLLAENSLTEAVKADQAADLGKARQEVALAARQAVDLLHHLSDFVLKEPSPSLSFRRIEDVRAAASAHYTFCAKGGLWQM